MNIAKDLEFYKIVKLLDFLKYDSEKSVSNGRIVCKNGDIHEGFFRFLDGSVLLLNKAFAEVIINASEIQSVTTRDLSKDEVNNYVGELEERLKQL